MKRTLSAIAAALCLLLPITVFAGYVIHLKDGQKFVTDQYYEEGDQIKFKRYGGLIGIEKDRILEIVETEDPVEPPEKKVTPAEAGEKVEAPAQEPPGKEAGEREVSKEQEKVEKVPEKAPEPAPGKSSEPEETEYDTEKRTLMEKYYRVRQRFVQAKASGDRIAAETAQWEMGEVLKKLSELERKHKEQAGTEK